MSQESKIQLQESKVRLDKWLWACRFYKTRAIAKAAIEGGKVHYQNQKPKPGKIVQIGETVKLRQGFDEKTVVIKELSDKRGPAKVAQTLYEETKDSVKKREEIAQMRKLSAPATSGRPDKKQRRLIHRFKNIHDYNPDAEKQ
ncbi:ribosome-associated heat shock protein Hsp15 [Aliikangiella coralliicola]|uniref:Heat shock protein 15 n=1 Tax=Aliikangiella coralliicola TaxID=2592383 RepID=A0A545U7R3_9GAMM|nr:ribosome-associated heat shock protein Hsp15 [Aliikangiella coralliicola]TQV85507.1 ribosome-associated heat shock protein Hsp15 [Aliikangiella coralliicola]